MKSEQQEEFLKRVRPIYRSRVEVFGPEYEKAWGKLRERLLALGGDEVVPPLEREFHLDALVRRSSLDDLSISGPCATLELGENNACHENTALLWLAGEIDYIVTGYALSSDQLWRQHTWGEIDDGVVETTEDRVLYAGIILGDEESIRFCLGNAAESIDAYVADNPGRFMPMISSILEGSIAMDVLEGSIDD